MEPGTLFALQQAGISQKVIDTMVDEWGFWSLSDLKGISPDEVDGLNGLKKLEAKRLKEVVEKQNAAPTRPASARRQKHLDGQSAGKKDQGSNIKPAAAQQPAPAPRQPPRALPPPTGNSKVDSAVRDLMDPSCKMTELDLSSMPLEVPLASR